MIGAGIASTGQGAASKSIKKSVMTRGRHGDHVSVIVLGNPQNCFFNRSIDNFDGLVCTHILSDASVFVGDRTQITPEQVVQRFSPIQTRSGTNIAAEVQSPKTRSRHC